MEKEYNPALQFDAFTAGIEDGGLRSSSSIAILACYIIARSEEKLTKKNVVDALVEGKIANYFEITSAISKMIKTDNLVGDIQNIIEKSQRQAYQAVNVILAQRNWLIGYRIAQEEMHGEERAEYGTKIIKTLSKKLTEKYGKGYDRSNLYHYLRFYKAFPEIVDTVSRQSYIRLSWSHYRVCLLYTSPSPRDRG